MIKASLKKLVVAGAIILGAPGVTLATDTSPSAQMLSDTCAGCHGTDGASGGPATPTIAGLSNDYFIEVMQGYKSGEVPSTIMGRLARGYGDDDFQKMAGYFSQLPFAMAEQPFDAKLANKGEKLHDSYCEKCHAEGGASAEDDSGILAGQWKPYIQWALEDYNTGERQMIKKMKKKMKRLLNKEGDGAIQALLEYYASQR